VAKEMISWPEGWSYASECLDFRDNGDGSITVTQITVIQSPEGKQYDCKRKIRATLLRKSKPEKDASTAAEKTEVSTPS
jgi:hypothetical protein